MILVFALCSCIKSEDPCYGDKHIKADFYMEEVCYGGSCGPYWKNYQSNYSSGGYITFVSTSVTNAFPIRYNDSISYEWHIGAKIYHGDSVSINFATASNGVTIPVMLIVRQRPDSMCIPNDNGVDTIIKSLRIDKGTRLAFGNWQGTFDDDPNTTRVVSVKNIYNPIERDTFLYVSGLTPAYDSTVGEINSISFFRQEFNFTIDGNGTYNISGNGLTDSTGQNIQITYNYLDPPAYTKLIKKTFKGIKL